MRKTKEERSSRRPIKAYQGNLSSAGAKSVEVTIEVLAKSKEILDYMVDEADDLGLLDTTDAMPKARSWMVMVLVSIRHEYGTELHREVCSYMFGTALSCMHGRNV